jgi:transposase InsO family protein
MDIFSRKIVGFNVYEKESADYASEVFTSACLKEGIKADSLVLHSDNGSPMKGSTLLATLQKLGIIASFSRPSVSNDNPYSEALFRTVKYCSQYPNNPFESLEQANYWVENFVYWYNHVHQHSALKFVSPSVRHHGLDKIILEHRHKVYEHAKSCHPNRWSKDTRNWTHISEVSLNPNNKIKGKVA